MLSIYLNSTSYYIDLALGLLTIPLSKSSLPALRASVTSVQHCTFHDLLSVQQLRKVAMALIYVIDVPLVGWVTGAERLY